MKYCNDYAALLDLFVDGELTPAEMADIQAHLDTCPGCRAYVDDALAMRAAFPEVEDTVIPEGFADSVMAAVAASVPVKKPARKTPWLKVAMPLAACLALVIVLQNGPASGNRKWAAGTAKTEAAPAAAETTAEAPAAPAAMAPSLKMTTADAVPEEAKMEAAEEETVEETAAETGGVTQDGAPTGTPKAKTEESINYSYTADFAVRMEVPAEAARFLEGFSPTEETDTERHYLLTEDEASTLQGQLGHAGIAYIAEEGIDAAADTVLVVLKK